MIVIIIPAKMVLPVLMVLMITRVLAWQALLDLDVKLVGRHFLKFPSRV